MNFSTLQDGLYDWISTETSLEVVWEYANAPRPTLPYISLLIPTITPVGQVSSSQVDDAGLMTILSQNIMTISISYHGAEEASSMSGQQLMAQILLSVRKQSVNKIFYDNNIGYLTRLAQNTIQNQLGTSFQEKVVMDLLFLLVTDVIDDVGLIETVEIAGQFLYESGDERYSNNIIIED